MVSLIIGQNETQDLFPVWSPYVLSGHSCTHLFVVFSPNKRGACGHYITHIGEFVDKSP
jgi:hypothetical protein